MKISDAKNILIIKWGALGDIIASTPAIRTVREAFPNAKIVLLTNRLMKDIIPPKTLVDELLIDENIESRGFVGLITILKLLFKLQQKKFDLAINLRWTSDRCAILTYLSGAKLRVSSGPKGLMNLYNIKVEHPAGRYHEIHRNLDIIKALGINNFTTDAYTFISDIDKHFVNDFFNTNSLIKGKTICIHPGASKINRAWAADKFKEIASMLVSEFNVKVLVTWGKLEYNLAKTVAGYSDNIIIAPETKTIGELSALIQNCSMFISNCTGPMNIAVAVKTPVIALLGSSHPLDWGPYGEIHRTIKSPIDLEHYSDETEQQAFDAIQVSSVWDVVKKRWIEISSQKI
jgi:ADP-heptose:LPS heptosyltransferase